jgi:hypothetical protein
MKPSVTVANRDASAANSNNAPERSGMVGLAEFVEQSLWQVSGGMQK